MKKIKKLVFLMCVLFGIFTFGYVGVKCSETETDSKDITEETEEKKDFKSWLAEFVEEDIVDKIITSVVNISVLIAVVLTFLGKIKTLKGATEGIINSLSSNDTNFKDAINEAKGIAEECKNVIELVKRYSEELPENIRLLTKEQEDRFKAFSENIYLMMKATELSIMDKPDMIKNGIGREIVKVVENYEQEKDKEQEHNNL